MKPSETSVISPRHRADVVTVLLDLISVRICADHLLVEHHRRDVFLYMKIVPGISYKLYKTFIYVIILLDQ